MSSRDLSARLGRIEARYGAPHGALVDRAEALLQRLEILAPGGAAEAVRGMGYADRMPGTVVESEAHAAVHEAGAPCEFCNPFADPIPKETR